MLYVFGNKINSAIDSLEVGNVQCMFHNAIKKWFTIIAISV